MPELAEKVSAAAVSMMAMAVGVTTVGVSFISLIDPPLILTTRFAVADRALSEMVTAKVSVAVALRALIAVAFGA